MLSLSLLFPHHHYSSAVCYNGIMVIMVLLLFGSLAGGILVIKAIKMEGDDEEDDYGTIINSNNNVCHDDEDDYNTCNSNSINIGGVDSDSDSDSESDNTNNNNNNDDNPLALQIMKLPSSNWIQPLRHLISYAFEYVLDYTNNNDDDELELDYIMAYFFDSTSKSLSDDDGNINTIYFTSHPDRVSLAAVAIWSYIIPQLYIEYAQFKLSLSHQHQRIKEDQRRGIQKALTRCFWGNLISGMVLYCVSASIVCFMTSSSPSLSEVVEGEGHEGDVSNTNGGGGLDRRASDIVTGLSRLFAGVISLMLSVKLCQWLGVYKTIAVDSQRRRIIDDDDNYYYNFKSIRELKFDFSYALQNRLIGCYAFHLYFSCDTNGNAQSIKYGTLGGIVLGTFFILVVNKVRTHPILKQYRYLIAIFIAAILSFASLICIGLGIYFIERVWREDRTKSHTSNNHAATTDTDTTTTTTLVDDVPKITFRICCIWIGIVCFGVHGVAMYLSHSNTSTTKTAQNTTSSSGIITTLETEESTTVEKTTSNNNNNSMNKNGSRIRRARYKSEVFQEGALGLQQIKKLLVQEENQNQNQIEEEGNKGDDRKEVEQTASKTTPSPSPPSYLSLISSKFYEIYGFGGRKNSPSNNNIVNVDESTSTSLLLFQFGRSMHYIVWYTASLSFLFMTIVNIGATYQQDIVRSNLNAAFTQLYPSDYHTGKMCAWDNKSPKGHIRTFNTLQEVVSNNDSDDDNDNDNNSNYTIIHCGECAACSNWNDLKLQWTTRNVLAKIARKCAQKSILGTIEDAQECNEKTIGFTPECAKCWTDDELCARDNCFWIYLQSTMINAMTDFRVGYNDITSATCDEALCGPEFGPCVGAIRRRMNIKSDIERPISQQCLPVQEDWSVIFDHE